MNEALQVSDAHDHMMYEHPNWKFCPFCGERLKKSNGD